ncbi:TerB family tellurite resistance protein [Tropicimonas isoalkanivorans]|nr:TerB family tellurite resistance protein [Tropicimonas isoalkanivorans]
MFTDLLNRLFASDETPLPELDGRHAMAGMLVRMAKLDNLYAVEEIQRIDRILGASYGLNPVEAARLRAEAEKLEAQAPEDGRFATAVRDRLDRAHREAVLVAMWRIALADGTGTQTEFAYLERAAARLGLDGDAAVRARMAAAGAEPLEDSAP